MRDAKHIWSATPEREREREAAAEATSERGILFKPEEGSAFVVIEASCLAITKTTVTGSAICEITPKKVKALTGKVVCKVQEANKGKQFIQKFVGGTKNNLEAFGIPVGFEGTEEVTFEKEVEVT